MAGGGSVKGPVGNSTPAVFFRVVPVPSLVKEGKDASHNCYDPVSLISN